MSRNKWWAKLLRIVGIVLMSLTAAFTLLGGAGTSCVALNPAGFGGKFAGIAPYQWLWILFVLIGTAAGIMGVRAVVLLVKGRQNAWRYALIALIIGTAINLIHLFASRALRNGSSMPVDMILYTNVLTLVIFLIFRIPAIWQGVNYEKPASEEKTGKNAAAIALGACGLLALTIQFMMAPTHTIGGINYADVWHVALTLIGTALILAGGATARYARLPVVNAAPEIDKRPA
jgi:surface polysaccharide O-acyltransferase-like enzyme